MSSWLFKSFIGGPKPFVVGFIENDRFVEQGWFDTEIEAERCVNYRNGGQSTDSEQAAANEMKNALQDLKDSGMMPAPSGASLVILQVTLLPGDAQWIALTNAHTALNAALRVSS